MNIIRRIRTAHCTTKATDTDSEYAILTACPRQQLLHERANVLRLYVHCLSFKFYIRDRLANVFYGRMFCELLVQPTPTSPIRSSARDALYGRSKYLIPRTSQEKQQFPRESSPR